MTDETEYIGTATYSPEDNKLRLYPVHRLDTDTYTRVKKAGFSWAPRQELFVAPAWSPDREDLLVELCGEVDDEDTSLVDRATDRAERFEEYSDRRYQEATATLAGVDTLANGIPLGQPILVGHHSEKRARKDAEKIESGMRRAVKLWSTSTYWECRAEGAIHAAKYKERPDVRARRIKTIEADLRKVQRTLTELRDALAFWPSSPTLHAAMSFANVKDHSGVTLEDGTHHWSIWCALNDGKATLEWVVTQRCRRLPKAITHYERWEAHHQHRLVYERAMLQETGGTVADRTGPEVGGACQCWAAPHGGWAFIAKVNKVSVTIYDNWGNGGRNFSRTIPFDKVKALMTRDQVEAARARGGLLITSDNTGFHLRGGEEVPDTQVTTPTEFQPPKETRDAAPFRQLRETLRGGSPVLTVAAPNLFPTPPEIATRMVDLLRVCDGDSVLEPSAGTGRLVEPLINHEGDGWAFGEVSRLVMVEVNPTLCNALERSFPVSRVVCCDFLQVTTDGVGTFSRILMNPPFEKGVDMAHITHALRFLQPGGVLVALCANGPRQRAAFMDRAEHWEDLPAGSFRSEGTDVNVALMVLRGEEVSL